jgi:thymidine phosphorylase
MSERHDAVEVIIAKRDGAELTDGQIDWVIDAYTRGEVQGNWLLKIVSVMTF